MFTSFLQKPGELLPVIGENFPPEHEKLSMVFSSSKIKKKQKLSTFKNMFENVNKNFSCFNLSTAKFALPVFFCTVGTPAFRPYCLRAPCQDEF